MKTAECDRRSQSGARKPRRAPWWCVLLIALVAVVSARTARALEARVRDVHAGSDVVVAAVEIKDVVPDSLKHVITDGSTLHLRLQAELWESRPVWDRLVYPALVRVFR